MCVAVPDSRPFPSQAQFTRGVRSTFRIFACIGCIHIPDVHTFPYGSRRCSQTKQEEYIGEELTFLRRTQASDRDEPDDAVVTTATKDSGVTSLSDGYLTPLLYPQHTLLSMKGDLKHQSMLDVPGNGRRSVLPEHCFSPIRLRRPFGYDYLVPSECPQQLGPLAWLRLQAQHFHDFLRNLRRSAFVQSRLAEK